MPVPDFFFNTPSSSVAIETLEISHNAFSQVYRIVRNHTGGTLGYITAPTEEIGNPTQTFYYYPCNIQMASSEDDLDYTLKVTFGDLGEIIPSELDRVFANGSIKTKPSVKYRVYQWNNGDGSTLLLSQLKFYGDPMEIKGISFNQDGCTFEASPNLTNSNSIGMKYTTDVFEGLRGFV